jgi:hypothetical protein
MKTFTVGMLSSYRGITQYDWLWHQTPQAFGRWGKIELVAQAPQPDYLLLYNFDFSPYYQSQSKTLKSFVKATAKGQLNQWLSREELSPEAKIRSLLRDVPKENIFVLTREPPLPEVVAKQANEYRYAAHFSEYVSGPSESAPIPEYMPAIWYVNVLFQELNQGTVPTKHRPCSWITSGINRSQNHQRRLDFLGSIVEAGLPVDLYGRDLPAWSHGYGPLGNKWAGMAPYHYNLAIENYAENDLYVSEKLWDALLSWCLPIYYGGGAADKLLPAGSFLRLPSLDAEGLAYIQSVISSPDAWYEAKSAIAEARQIILHELNLVNWLDQTIRNR